MSDQYRDQKQSPNGERPTPDPLLIAEAAAAFNDRSLQLFVLPTEKCNFRCTYCYEKFDVGRMKPSTVQAVKAFIDRRIEHLDALSVEWFGGEPLLGRPVIFDICEHIQASLANFPTVMYGGSMTTNGYLLDEGTATRLIGLGVRSFQISLDGPPDIHDQSRIRADAPPPSPQFGITSKQCTIVTSTSRSGCVYISHLGLRRIYFLSLT